MTTHVLQVRRCGFLSMPVAFLSLGMISCATAVAQERSTSPVRSDNAALLTGTGTDLRLQVAGGVGGAKIELVPIPAKVGMYPANTMIVDQEIVLDELPTTTRVWLEFKVSGWDPDGSDILEGTGVCTAGFCSAGRNPEVSCAVDSDCDQPTLGVFSATIEGDGFLDADLDLDGDLADDGDQIDVLPAMVSCPSVNAAGNTFCETTFGELGTKCLLGSNIGGCPFALCCKPMFTEKVSPRPDILCAGVTCSSDTLTSNPTFDWFLGAAAESPDVFHDDGTVRYVGTLVVDVPPGAAGRYTIPFKLFGATYIADRQAPPAEIPLAEISGASIRIGGCASHADCDDNDACTTNQCNFTLRTCQYPLVSSFDTATECCVPASGNIQTRADASASTCDVCSLPNSRGIPTHSECNDGDACTVNQCNTSQACQYPLVSGFDPLVECCDSVSGNIAMRDDADDCTADVCSLPNSRGMPSHPPLPNTTVCDDLLTCTLDDHCDGVQSQADGGCIGTSIESLTCGSPTDCETLTGTAFPCSGGFCDCAELPRINWNADVMSPDRATRTLNIDLSPPAVGPGGALAAIEIRMISLQNPDPSNYPCCPPPNLTSFEQGTCSVVGESLGCARWVGQPRTYLEDVDLHAKGVFKAARLQCIPYYHDWTTEGPFAVFGAEIVPSSAYDAVLYGDLCTGIENGCAYTGSPVEVLTRRAGDIWPSFTPPSPLAQPDGLDQIVILNKFKSLPNTPSKRVATMQPNVPQYDLNVSGLDISSFIDNLVGKAFPFSGPCPCPSPFVCNATSCSMDAQCMGGSCVKTCNAGPNDGLACINDLGCRQCDGGIYDGYPCQMDSQCVGGTCPANGACPITSFCRDRCGRCSP